MPENLDDAEKLRKQVSTLAEFGKGALRVDDVGALLQEATRLVSDAIDVDLVKVLEILPHGETMLVRAGVNWAPGVVGHATIRSNEGSPAGYALQTGEPVICENVETEDRFQIPSLLIQHGVKSTVNVLIRGEGDKPFGILEVDSRQIQRFARDDIDFLQNYANLLSAAIKRVNAQAELAERAQHERVLRHELQHRINNMLATVRAVARRTRTRSESLDEFARSFDNRLAAIARTHALLSGTEKSAVAMRELLTQELSAHGAVEGENLTQHGPGLLISGKQAQALSMAFHELATNAVKHGALSVDNGHIDVSWKTELSSTEKQLSIRWRETGVTIEREPARRGFGTDILERSIPHLLRGTFERTFHRDGIECVILLPLEAGRADE
ncbi:MAG: GAF domain-containing protein [Hyphomicrobiales bacterium]|nr:GAF domain-containing protein [Hyphomicrobiales bacterium]